MPSRRPKYRCGKSLASRFYAARFLVKKPWRIYTPYELYRMCVGDAGYVYYSLEMSNFWVIASMFLFILYSIEGLLIPPQQRFTDI